MLALTAGAAGCGSDDVTNTAADRAALADPFEREGGEDVAPDSIVGLEVSAVGVVTEVLSDEALRLGRDGLGALQDTPQEGTGLDYDYDYGEYLVEDDEELEDDDAASTGVLVVDGKGLRSVEEGEAVRVSGTVRRLDLDRIESLYDIDLAEESLVGDEGSLVVVADTITEADTLGQAAGAGTASPLSGS